MYLALFGAKYEIQVLVLKNSQSLLTKGLDTWKDKSTGNMEKKGNHMYGSLISVADKES